MLRLRHSECLLSLELSAIDECNTRFPGIQYGICGKYQLACLSFKLLPFFSGIAYIGPEICRRNQTTAEHRKLILQI